MVNLAFITDVFSGWIVALNSLWTTFTSPLSSLFGNFNPNDYVDYPVLQLIMSGLGVSNFSLLELMLGAGLVFYLFYQFIIWVLNLIT